MWFRLLRVPKLLLESMGAALIESRERLLGRRSESRLSAWPSEASSTFSSKCGVALLVLLAAPLAAFGQINSPTNAISTVGLPFSYQISSTNNATNYLASGLPPGLVSPGTNGLISGLPQIAGTYTSTVSAIKAGVTNSTNVVIKVNPPSGPELASPRTFFGMQSEPLRYPLLSVPSHSNVPTTFSVSNLPSGTTLISNVTTNTAYTNVVVTNYFINSASVGTNGSFVVPVVTRNQGGTNTNSVTFVISPSTAPVITSSANAVATVGVPFSFDVTAMNSPLRFRVVSVVLGTNTNAPVSITNGILTNGLSFSNVSNGGYTVGRISGTPSVATNVVLGLEAMNNTLTSATQTLTISVAQPQPTVILTEPLGQTFYVIGSSFFVNAQAFDRLPDNIVPSSVGFQEDSSGAYSPIPGIVSRLGDFYGVEYYPSAGAGLNFNIQAQAQNSLGQQVTSAALPMVPYPPLAAIPTIEMLPLFPGPQTQAGSTVTLRARAFAPEKPIQRVEFYVNKVFVGSTTAVAAGTTNEYQFAWTTPADPGSFEVNARVVSENIAAGALGTGSPVFYASVITRTPVVVNTIVGVAPSVAIVSPSDGGQLGFNVPNRLVAAASIAQGAIAQVQFYANGQPVGAPVTQAPYAVDFTPKSYGSYELFAIATSDVGLATVSPKIVVSVPQGAAPSVALINTPSTATTGSQIILQASASDSDGTIQSVEFFSNGLPLPSPDAAGNPNPDVSAPYSYVFAPSAPGRYELIARATDNSGNVTDSEVTVLNVSVGTPPTVSLVVSGGGALSSPVLSMARSGTDIVYTYLQKNGLSYVLQQTSDLTASWATSSYTPADDPDQTGVPTGFTKKRFVVPASSAPLFFRLIYPASNLYAVNETAVFNAAANDTDGSISKVDLLVNGIVVSTLNGGPYRFNYQLTAPGLYTVVARATDNLGNVTDSAPQYLNVTDGAAPSVSITVPTKSTLTIPQVPLGLFWVANDTDGYVEQVQVLVNGVVYQTFQSGSGNTTYAFPSQGVYVFKVRATDNLGNVTDSAPVTVTVDNSATDPNPLVVMDQRTIADQGYVVGSQLYFNATALAQGASNAIATNGFAFLLGSQVEIEGVKSPIYLGGQPVYSAGYSILAGSPRTVTARAIDTNGNVGFSDTKSFYFANPFSPLPSVDLLPLQPSTEPVAGGVLQLRAKATFPVSQFNGGANPATSRVEFYADGAYLGIGSANTNAATTNAYTHTFDWVTPTNAATFKVTARVVQLNYNSPVVDSNGNQIAVTPYYGSAFSPQVITTNTSTNQAPAIWITSPTNNARVPIGLTNPITTSNTVATNASVKEVQFYVNGLYATNVTQFPYTYQFVATNTGIYKIAAVIVDSFGLQGSTTDVLTLNATSGNAPTSFLKTSASATATAVLGTGANSNKVVSFTNLNGGSGYATSPNVRLGGGGGSNAAALATINSNTGVVTNLSVTSSGSGYTNAPFVAIDPPPIVWGNTQSILLEAAASDSDGTVARVDFLVNGTNVNTVTNLPYSYNMPATAVGQYTLVARVTDNLGNVTDSLPVVLDVITGRAPQVSIITPTNNAKVPAYNWTTVIASATDSDGSVTNVAFRSVSGNGVFATNNVQSTNGLFTNSIYFSGSGTNSFVATAFDNSGNTADSLPIQVVVPTTTITNSILVPETGTTNLAGNAILLKAAATTTTNAQISQVQFFVASPTTNWVGSATAGSSNTYLTTFTPAAPGSYTIRALATDTSGNSEFSSNSPTIRVIDYTGEQPWVSFVPPAEGTYFTRNSQLYLNFFAQDSALAPLDTATNAIELYVNGARYTNSPVMVYADADSVGTYYGISAKWTGSIAGPYYVYAKVRDTAGNAAFSSAGLVTIVGSNLSTPIASLLPVTNAYFYTGVSFPLTNAVQWRTTNAASSSNYFYANGTQIGTGSLVGVSNTTNFYTTAWTPWAPNTSVELTVRASEFRGTYTPPGGAVTNVNLFASSIGTNTFTNTVIGAPTNVSPATDSGFVVQMYNSLLYRNPTVPEWVDGVNWLTNTNNTRAGYVLTQLMGYNTNTGVLSYTNEYSTKSAVPFIFYGRLSNLPTPANGGVPTASSISNFIFNTMLTNTNPLPAPTGTYNGQAGGPWRATIGMASAMQNVLTQYSSYLAWPGGYTDFVAPWLTGPATTNITPAGYVFAGRFSGGNDRSLLIAAMSNTPTPYGYAFAFQSEYVNAVLQGSPTSTTNAITTEKIYQQRILYSALNYQLNGVWNTNAGTLSMSSVTNLLGAPPVISPSPQSTNGVRSNAFNYRITTAATNATYFTSVSGSLPPGLSMSTNGIISGTPTSFGSWTNSVRASNLGGYSPPANIIINIAP